MQTDLNLMATNTSNNTHDNTIHVVWMPLPVSQCIPWLVAFSSEFLAINILNILTIIVIVKQPRLQRRSTYLIIHLAIVNLLVGAVSGPLWMKAFMGNFCDLWDNRDVETWERRVIVTLQTFPYSSLINLAVIALERVHATFRPFKHRFIKKWVYGVIITVIWIMTIGMVVMTQVMYLSGIHRSKYVMVQFTYFLFPLFVICFSYVCIFIKVRCRPHPRHHGAAGQRERKLTSTLFLVTLASLLTWFPSVIYYTLRIFYITLVLKPSLQSYFHILLTLHVLSFANSLINSLIYVLRMPEFRAGVSQLFRRNPNRQPNPVDLPQQNL